MTPQKNNDLKHAALEATPKQRANLKKLADYLAGGKTEHKFDMGYYMDEGFCGTVACAVGHGPSAGIGQVCDDHWEGYMDKNFTPCHIAFVWLFSSVWSETDNTPQGASTRIYYALEHGAPVGHEFIPFYNNPAPASN